MLIGNHKLPAFRIMYYTTVQKFGACMIVFVFTMFVKEVSYDNKSLQCICNSFL